MYYGPKKTVKYESGEVRSSDLEEHCMVEKRGHCSSFPESCSAGDIADSADKWTNLAWTDLHIVSKNCMTWAAVVMLEKQEQ